MAITTPAAIAGNATTTVRSLVAVADSATLNDTNFPPADLTACAGWRRVALTSSFAAGTNPTVTVVPLFRVGALWVAGTATSAFGVGAMAIVEVFGHDVFFRISAIAGTPTNASVQCMGWEPFRYDGPARG